MRILLAITIISLVAIGSLALVSATTPATTENQTETGDGSICVDYEEGETPPAHLNCDELDETEAVVEDENSTAVDNMPTVIGRQPDIAGPAAEQCREPLENAFEAVLLTDEFIEFSYISEHVQEVYCNDVHVVVPGIPYNHIGYTLQKYPERVYLNPAAWELYPAPEDLSILIFHEARHLEQYKECKADRSTCMTSEEREADAVQFENEMRERIFPASEGEAIIFIPPAGQTTLITLNYIPLDELLASEG